MPCPHCRRVVSPPVSERRAAQLADTVEVTPGEPLPPMPRGKRPKVATSKGRERTTNRGLILAVSALGGGMAVAIVGGILLFVAYALFSKGERAGSSPPQKSVLSELTAAEVALLKSAEAGRSWLDVHTVQPGEAGFIREPITILQVAADDAFLTNVNGVTVLIVGVDTSRLADGRRLLLSRSHQLHDGPQYAQNRDGPRAVRRQRGDREVRGTLRRAPGHGGQSIFRALTISPVSREMAGCLESPKRRRFQWHKGGGLQRASTSTSRSCA
jgi:hypothetical protein